MQLAPQMNMDDLLSENDILYKQMNDHCGHELFWQQAEQAGGFNEYDSDFIEDKQEIEKNANRAQ